MNCITVVHHVAAANAVLPLPVKSTAVTRSSTKTCFVRTIKGTVVGAMSVLDGIKEKHDSSITTYVNTRVDSPPAS